MTSSSTVPDSTTRRAQPTKLLDRVRWHLRVKHYSIRTEQLYLQWIRRYILFHGKRHPTEMGEEEIAAFLSHLAIDRHVAASTQNQHVKASLTCQEQIIRNRCSTFTSCTQQRMPDSTLVILQILEGDCDSIVKVRPSPLRIGDPGN